MGRLHFLGTASALPSQSQDNASLLIESNGAYLMIDCSGTPYRKLLKLGVDPHQLQHIVITHHHIDHIYGLPSLIECLWIAGRTKPLHIYALPTAMPVVETLLDLWELRNRFINQFPIHLHLIGGKPDEFIFETPQFQVRTTPTLHSIPSIATKVIFPNGKVFVYSSDTAPCQSLIDFARGVDHFLMECTFCDSDEELADITYHLHSANYGSMAAAVGAKHTIMIHHSEHPVCSHEAILKEIEGTQPSLHRVSVPRDFDSIEME